VFEKKQNSDTTNFWISYADLMAGLLFVFILLIGAIVVKSIVLKSNLNQKEKSLIDTKKKLNTKSKVLNSTKSLLTLKEEEIDRLKNMLLDKKAEISNLSNKLIILQTDIKDMNETLGKRDSEIKKYKGDILILSNQLVDANHSIKLKDEQMLALLDKLNEKENRYERLVADLQKTKTRIKNLTGIKIKVIAALKESLGDSVSLDKSGALRLSSKVLFDKGKANLKEDAKANLKEIFSKYIKTLVENEDIRKHLDKIVIEGHSDSDGSYLYNLELSQRRAYSVMNFLTSLDFAKKYDIKSLVMASGRSYLDPIMKDGVEDKNASRRIEIKFLLKNNEAFREIERILEDE